MLAISAQELNIAFLVALAFAVAASANLPALVDQHVLEAVQHPRRDLGIYGGLITCVGLVFFSPIVSGKGVDPVRQEPVLLPTSVDISWFPLENPGIVSIPRASCSASLGTLTSKEPEAEERYTELEVRALTGAGLGEGGPALTASGPASPPRARGSGRAATRHVDTVAGSSTVSTSQPIEPIRETP